MKRKTWLGIGLLTLTLGLGCSEPEVGSGYVTTRTRDLSSFSEISVSSTHGEVRVELCDCRRQAVVMADDNLIDDIDVYVDQYEEDDPYVLYVEVDDDIIPSNQIEILIRTPAVHSIYAGGSHDFALHSDIGADACVSVGGTTYFVASGQLGTLDVNLNGTSLMEAPRIELERLKLNMEDTTTAYLSGSVTHVEAKLRDTARLDADTLISESFEGKLRHTSRADVCATVELEAKVKHNSTLSYRCDPDRLDLTVRDNARAAERDGTPMLQDGGPVRR